MSNKGLALIAIVGLVALPQAVSAQGGKKGSAVTDAPVCGAASFTDGEMVCSCPAGASNGSVWGSGPYTADSNVCTAARHAGAVGGDGGIVRLTERPGQSSYEGSSSNGVTSSDWGSYGQSFDVASIVASTKSSLPACSTMPSGVDEHACNCSSDAARGSVWGNGPYTADSNICTAALHNGYIEEAGGDVYVLRVKGLESYAGGEGYGITTSDWSSYDSSIIFDWNR